MKYWYTWISNTTRISNTTSITEILWNNWYTWISNTTSITGEILIYIDIHEYQTHEYQTQQV